MEERYETFTVLIAKLSRSIRKIKASGMAEFDLKSPHVSVLYYLYITGPLSAGQLCEICDEDKAGVSRSIEYLEKAGYIACDTNAPKRYRSAFSLTELGEKTGKRIAEKVNAVLLAAENKVSESDREIMYRALKQIDNNLTEFCKKYDK